MDVIRITRAENSLMARLSEKRFFWKMSQGKGFFLSLKWRIWDLNQVLVSLSPRYSWFITAKAVEIPHVFSSFLYCFYCNGLLEIQSLLEVYYSINMQCGKQNANALFTLWMYYLPGTTCHGQEIIRNDKNIRDFFPCTCNGKFLCFIHVWAN